MNAKLTLTIEQFVIENAKKYAKDKGKSLSGVVENYLKVITKEDVVPEIEITPVVKSLKGSFKATSDLDYKNELVKSISKKYL
jgi:hypothetical protein